MRSVVVSKEKMKKLVKSNDEATLCRILLGDDDEERKK